VLHNATYLIATTHQSTRKHHQREAILEWATTNQWIKLEVIQATESTVRFRATYLDEQLQLQVHQEFSTFVFEKEEWFYVDGNFD
jgi:SEC-C motif-containing protein